MSNTWSITAYTEQETERLGSQLAKQLQPGMFVALYGGLGAGKTAFCRGIGTALGIFDIMSPTFTIVREHAGVIRLYHFDVYRLSSYEELLDIGYQEYTEEPAVIVMEWPENVPGALPEARFDVLISGSGKEKREITITAYGEACMKALNACRREEEAPC